MKIIAKIACNSKEKRGGGAPSTCGEEDLATRDLPQPRVWTNRSFANRKDEGALQLRSASWRAPSGVGSRDFRGQQIGGGAPTVQPPTRVRGWVRGSLIAGRTFGGVLAAIVANGGRGSGEVGSE